jgi:hypothetical protein
MPFAVSTAKKFRADRDFLMALVIGALVRLVLLDGKSIWHDEALSLLTASQPTLREAWDLTLRLHRGVPLFFAGVRACLPLGPGAAQVRLFPVLGGIVALFCALRLVRETLPSRMGRPVMLFAALSPFLIEYSQEVRAYSWLGAAELMMSLALWRGLNGSRAAWARVYGAALAAGTLLHPAVWIWWGAHAAVVGWTRRPKTARLFAAATVPAALIFSFAVLAARGAWLGLPPMAYRCPSIVEYLKQTALLFGSGHGAGPLTVWWLPLVVSVTAAAGGTALWLTGRRLASVFLLSQVLFPVTAIYVGIMTGMSTQLRYLAAAPVTLLILIGAGICARPGLLKEAVLAVFLAQQAESFQRWHTKPPLLEPTFCLLSKKPLREASLLVKEGWRRGDRVIHVSTASFLPFKWMEPEFDQTYLIRNPDLAAVESRPLFARARSIPEAVRGARRVWLVVCPWRFRDPPAVPAEYSGSLDRLLGTPRRYELPGVDVYLAEVRRGK